MAIVCGSLSATKTQTIPLDFLTAAGQSSRLKPQTPEKHEENHENDKEDQFSTENPFFFFFFSE